MQKHGSTWIYSPSDLIQFLENEAVTWFDRLDKENAGVLSRDPQSTSDELIQSAGQVHEREFLERLILEGYDVADLSAANASATETLAAMKAGREVLYQARLEANGFAGYADFLFRVAGASDLGSYHYEVWDTKLARSLKPYFAIQLCCYAELLELSIGTKPEHIGVVLGSGERKRLRTNDYFFYYRAVKKAFLEQQEHFDSNKPPTLIGTADYRHWTAHVTRVLAERDDLSFVANIRASQIEKLCNAGVQTLAELADSTGEITGIQKSTLERLRNQARLQRNSREIGYLTFEQIPVDPERPRMGLAALPPASKQDIVFDMEGYPLMQEGLEYLFGAIFAEQGGSLCFRDWWAHNRAQERQAFEEFIHWVHGRWRADPAMHVYHYASYETTALKRLMCRFGCCEAEVDDLLRNGVFVDLFSVLRQSLLIGCADYSLKTIERLYLDEERQAEVSTAAASMVEYHRWLEQPDGKDWRTSAILSRLRDYNEEDCRSTWDLLEWLRALQQKSDIQYVHMASEPKKPGEASSGRALLSQQMLTQIPSDRSTEPERWRIHELLAYLLEFHRREHKPSWWFVFERAAMTEQELLEDPDCLGGLERTAAPPQLTETKKSYRYEYRFDAAQESKLRDGDSCRCAHDIDLKFKIEKIDYDHGLLWFTLGKSRPAPPNNLSLIPDDIFNAGVIADSIERVVQTYRASGELEPALKDLLFRQPARIVGHCAGPLPVQENDLLTSIKSVIGRMDDTTLFIQGPPGCGKTFTGGEVIAALLQARKKVAVTSNSHRAIALLLKSAADAADRMGLHFRGAKAGCDEDQDEIHPSIALLPDSGSVFKEAILPDLVGGTAWVFARPEANGRFDYLFVDEAGQVSLANLVGMSAAARNIVLIGDQMQLNQPTQGVHPVESGKSVLEYLLQSTATVPPEMGILLPNTWRMRPEVCRFISDAIYDGKIAPHPITSQRSITVNGPRHWILHEAGLVYVPVLHHANTYESEEEVETIKQIVGELTQHLLQLPGHIPRQVGLQDILVVAPYNLQVRRLQTALPGIHVGTVDKFQGQEAPIVIFSMTASDGNSSPRGIEFLFSRNRLNVAISRAQMLAVVVGSPKLLRTRCNHLHQIELVNLFCHLVETGTAAAGALA